MGKRETEGQRRSPRRWLALLLTVCPALALAAVLPPGVHSATLALRTWQASLPPQSKPGWVREWASHRGRGSDLSGPYYRRGVAGIARDLAPEA